MESYKKCFSNNPIYLIPRMITDFKYEIIWAWQRVFKGYDERWDWGTVSQLQTIMPKCLRELKRIHHGCPPDLWDKSKKKKECWKWTMILEKIARGFEASAELHELAKNKGKKFEKLIKERNEGLKLFVKYFENLWD